MTKELLRSASERAKLWVAGRGQDFAIDAAERFYYERELTAYGRKSLRYIVGKIKRGEIVTIRDEIGILDGLPFEVQGSEQLYRLNEPFLVAANHWNNGPVGGLWHVIATEYVLWQQTGREASWVMGTGKEELPWYLEPTRELLKKYIIEPNHRRVAFSRGAIYAGNSNIQVIRETRRALEQGKIVAVCPEGDMSMYLKEADAAIGTLLYYGARNNMPIVAVAAWNQGRRLFMSVSEAISPEIVQDVANGVSKGDRSKAVGHYVMGVISSQLPPELRGFYR